MNLGTIPPGTVLSEVTEPPHRCRAARQVTHNRARLNTLGTARYPTPSAGQTADSTPHNVFLLLVTRFSQEFSSADRKPCLTQGNPVAETTRAVSSVVWLTAS